MSETLEAMAFLFIFILFAITPFLFFVLSNHLNKKFLKEYSESRPVILYDHDDISVG
jgi:hypothetical protein